MHASSKTFPGNRNGNRGAGRVRNGDDIWPVTVVLNSIQKSNCRALVRQVERQIMPSG